MMYPEVRKGSKRRAVFLDRDGTIAYDVPYCSSPEEFQLFLEGHIDALILQDPFRMGYDGVYTMDKILNGQTVTPRTVSIPAQVLTKENMNEPAFQKLLTDQGLL